MTSATRGTEAALEVHRIDALDLHDLRPRLPPGDDGHASLRHVEDGGEQSHELGVRAAVLGSRGHAYLPARSVPADDLRSRGTGRNAEVDAHHRDVSAPYVSDCRYASTASTRRWSSAAWRSPSFVKMLAMCFSTAPTLR